MSHFFGKISSSVYPFQDYEGYSMHKGNGYVIYISKSPTANYYSFDSGEVLAISGLPIERNGSPSHFPSPDELLLKVKNGSVNELDGHFSLLFISGNSFHFFTDIIGFREILLCEIGAGSICFATDERLLRKISLQKLTIDWSVFSGRWNLDYQISPRSSIEGTHRLTMGANAEIIDGSLAIRHPSVFELGTMITNGRGGQTTTILSDLIISPALMQEKEINLSLSGGLDSRVILSFLLANNVRFRTHTFGDASHPDVIIAKRIARELHIRHETINNPLPSDDSILVERLQKYCSDRKVTTSLTSYTTQHHFDYFVNDTDSILIDGGVGEIGRRRIFEKIRLLHHKDILSHDPKRIYPLISKVRADIFEEGHKLSLEKFAMMQIEEYISIAPDVGEIGVEHWLDLFVIRTALPNYTNFEQARLDSLLQSYMPFGQPSFVNDILALPIEWRRNAKLYRKIINDNYCKLTKYPLVKFNTTYPYQFDALLSYLWTKSKQIAGKTFRSNENSILLDRIEPFVRDTVSSSSFRGYEYYDINKILLIVDGYYSGKKEYTSQLDMLLSFELWRQSIS